MLSQYRGRWVFLSQTVVTAALLTTATGGYAGAGIATDGRAGPAATIAAANAGPGTFRVPQGLGSVAGSNLFHSFSRFNIDSGQTARFETNTAAIANVISRVTGGTASEIFGRLQLASPAGSTPAFFFINPAGVVFGAGATINVPGAFHVSTADYIKFANGDKFYADPANGSTLSSAAPEAFGFLGSNRAGITVKDGGRLETQGSQPISIVAGDVEIDGGNVWTRGGDIRVVAIGRAAQEIGFTGALPAASGELNLVNAGWIRSQSAGARDGGSIAVSAGNITIDSGYSYDYTGIFSLAYPDANAGMVNVRAGSIAITGQGSVGYPAGIFSQAWGGSGNAGNVEVSTTGSISLVNGGQISADTFSDGNAGKVTVHAGSISIDGQGSYVYTGYGYGYTGILSNANKGSAGNAGSVDVSTTGNLDIRNGGVLSTDTFSSGSAGTVKVSAGSIAVDKQTDKQTSSSDTGIFSRAMSSSTTGSAGSIDVKAAGLVSLDNGGAISSHTSSSRNAGTVAVRAGSIILDHGSVIDSDTATSSSGSAGSVEASATGRLAIDHGSKISSETGGEFSSGNAGTVTVHAGNITIGNGGKISSETGTLSAGGNAGSVYVKVEDALEIFNGGVIKSSTGDNRLITSFGIFTLPAHSNASDVTVKAATIRINGNGAAVPTGILSHSFSNNIGNVGNVDVDATGDIALLNGGTISSAALSSGNSGALKVSGGSITINGQGNNLTGIISDSKSTTGNVGTFDVAAKGDLSITNGGMIISGKGSNSSVGLIKVSADNITIDGKETESTGIFTNAQDSATRVGSIDVSAKNNLSISNGGIQASTFSSADGGTVTVSAGSIDIGRKGIIVSQASSTGNAGDIDVSSTGHIAITNGGGVSTSTLSSGNAGSIKLSAANIEINGHDRITGIFSITGGDGNAGSVEIHATTGNLSIGHGGSISSNTYAPGQAGTVIVDAVGSITIDGQGSSGNDVTIGISSDAKSGSTGNAGNVAVSAKKNLSIVNGGQISSDTLSLGNAGTVKVSAADIAISSGGGISSSTASSGNAGTVTVNANNITIDAFNQGGLPTGIFSESSVTDEGPSGHGGDIAVTADALTLTRGGVISARTSFNGRGGSINLQVNHLALTEGGSITALTSGTGSAGDIIIHSASDVTISGVSATDFRRDYDGQQVTGQFSGIYLNSQGSGNGGNLQLKTRQLTVNDGGLISAIAVDGNVASLPETQAGNIDIDAGSIILANGGAIDASTSGAGRAGSVTVDAGTSITITGKFDHALHPTVNNQTVSDQSHIGSSATYRLNPNARALGSGGDVRVTTPKLILTNGGQIAVNTEGAGRAGSIQIDAGTLLVDGDSSKISAAAEGSSGQTGFVSVTANDITLSNGGQISIENHATVAAPSALTPTSISVTAPRITILNSPHAITTESTGNVAAGSIGITASEQLFLDPSGITTTANLGNGGAIDIITGLFWLENSQIATSVRGLSGNGGNITISAESLIMNTGFIQANTAAPNASGGLVSITVDNLIASGGSLFLGDKTPYTYRPGVFGFNVIQAAAPTGVNGVVQISSPRLDITSSLVGFDTRLLNAQVARRLCGNSGGSSLVPVGRGGLPLVGADYLSPGQVSGLDFIASPVASLPAVRTSWRTDAFAPCLASL